MITQIIVLSLITFAFWWCFQCGEIFGIVQRWGSRLPEYLKNPLFDCAVCMHFWYGSIFYWLIFGHEFKKDWREWLIVVIAGLGLNAIIIKLWPCHDEYASG